MAVYEFPVLGFDPAPGDPAAVECLQRDVRQQADSLAESVRHLGRLHASSWTGVASDAFHEEATSLPADLSTAAHAYAEVAAALNTYAGELSGARAEALRLEQQAEQARLGHQAALGRVQQLSTPQPGEPDAAQGHRLKQLGAAQREAEQVGGDYDAILRRAQAVQDHMEAIANLAAQRILAAAASPPYHAPGGLQQAWDHVTSFVRQNADTIRQISSVLKIVSAIAGILAFVPVVGAFFGAVALVAAGVALALDILLKLSTGEGSWTSIGIDAALMLLPGAGKLFRTAVEAGRGERLVAATDRINVRGITPRAVWRDTSEPLWRFDSRSPDQVFRDGFRPRKTSNTNLATYVQQNRASAFVGTTRNETLRWNAQFRYEIHAPGGVDVNATLDNVYFPHEQEIAFPGGIQAQFVKGAHVVLPDGSMGAWIPNPGFVPT
jgi:uncharacterized protein YukE